MQPDVSLIIPVFNNEAYLDESLSSACAQTGPSLEIIVIDDGSTDASLQKIKAHAARDPRIVVISQANQGVSAARNAGLDRASGKWLAFLDGDDWMAPGTLALWHQQAERDHLDCLMCNGFSFEGDLQTLLDEDILRKQPWDSVLSGPAWMVHAVRVQEWPHYVWMQFCRRSVVEEAKIRFRRDMIHEDVPWTVQLALAVKRIGFSQPPHYGYRRNRASLTQSRDADKVRHRLASYLKVAALMKEFTQGQPPDVCRSLHKQTLREMGHFLGLMRKANLSRADRSQLASEFLSVGVPGQMLKGCSNYRELAAVFKAWYLCHIWKRYRAQTASI